MALGEIFDLTDVVDAIEVKYGTEPSTIQSLSKCADATLPSDTINCAKPNKLSDWEGFPVLDVPGLNLSGGGIWILRTASEFSNVKVFGTLDSASLGVIFGGRREPEMTSYKWMATETALGRSKLLFNQIADTDSAFVNGGFCVLNESPDYFAYPYGDSMAQYISEGGVNMFEMNKTPGADWVLTAFGNQESGGSPYLGFITGIEIDGDKFNFCEGYGQTSIYSESGKELYLKSGASGWGRQIIPERFPPPTNVTYAEFNISNDELTVSWDPIPGATSYNIHFRTTNLAQTQTLTDTTSSTSYTTTYFTCDDGTVTLQCMVAGYSAPSTTLDSYYKTIDILINSCE